MPDFYCYIFVRQDISPEQQLIQFGHVCAVAGSKNPNRDWTKVNFVGIGVKDERGLDEAMMNMDEDMIPYHLFREPDIGNVVTAVASVPLMGALRQSFSKYKTLRFGMELTT